MVANIQNPNQGTGEQQIKFWIQKMIRDEIAQYARANPLQIDPSGTLIVADAGIQSANYDPVAPAGWRLSGTAIEGFPISKAESVSCTATNFALTTTQTALASGTVTVPDGYTQCTAVVLAQMYAVNLNTTGGSNGTGGDALHCKATFNAIDTATATFATPVLGNDSSTATALGAMSFTGLVPGDALAYSISGASQYAALAARADNSARASFALYWTP